MSLDIDSTNKSFPLNSSWFPFFSILLILAELLDSLGVGGSSFPFSDLCVCICLCDVSRMASHVWQIPDIIRTLI